MREHFRKEIVSELVVDRSPLGEPLRINFNVSLPAVSCEFATVDMYDVIGTTRLNVTRGLRRVPLDAEGRPAGAPLGDPSLERRRSLEYDDEGEHAHIKVGDEPVDAPWTPDLLKDYLEQYDVVAVNFFAPWCSWCQRLEPAWVAATRELARRHPRDGDGRVRFGRVDCTREVALCRSQGINAFPSIRIFRHGSDDVVVGGRHEHESYYGDRRLEALLALGEALARAAGEPHGPRRELAMERAQIQRGTRAPGCNLSGFVLANKVPGSLAVGARADGHSFHRDEVDAKHVVHGLTFGAPPRGARRGIWGLHSPFGSDASSTSSLAAAFAAASYENAPRDLKELHPQGLPYDFGDKLKGSTFDEGGKGSSYVHYLQVVLMTVDPQRGPASRIDAYEYTAQSHAYVGPEADEAPAARFVWTVSPIQVVATAKQKPVYALFVSLCAILGGVLTLAGILDSTLHQIHTRAAKLNLGKQG